MPFCCQWFQQAHESDDANDANADDVEGDRWIWCDKKRIIKERSQRKKQRWKSASRSWSTH